MVPDSTAAGVDLRLRLLELESTIHREIESLSALAWRARGYEEATVLLGLTDLEVVKARRTRGHVLQLHGYLDAARVDLRAALRTISEVSAENEPWHAEYGDVLLCCSSVEVAAESPYTDGRDLVRRALAQEPNAGLLPGLLRNQLQFASIDEVALRQRRRPLAKQKSEPYEAALDELAAILTIVAPSARYAIWDSIVVAALRVGDTAAIREVTVSIARVNVNGAPNLIHRLTLHLAEAEGYEGSGTCGI
jgi:hypothetical protein